MTRKKTKDEFVQEAKEIHGDKYDYSKVKYINSNTNIIIICKEHGEFEQKPSKHLQGNGCSKCSKNYIPNTSEWIQEAKKIHGDKYDYSKVEYVNSKKNVIIICKEHGEFKQIPNNHLRGAGCSICSKSYGTKEYIKEAKKLHGDKYDYSKVEYVHSQTKIIIICKEHGEFKQTPSSHLQGRGCPKCALIIRANIKTSTTEEFIEKAKEIHNNKYDYQKVHYIDNKTNVTIICKEHGEFQQIPHNHLNGSGCIECGRINSKDKQTITKQEFIEKAKEIHGDNYDYSKINYINHKTNIIIICKEHGEFQQIPSNHLNGNDCPKCAINKRTSTTEEFIEKAKEIHGDKYNYQKVHYINHKTNIIIICKEHGEFQQTPNSHLNGSGCLECGIIRRANIKTSTTEKFIEKAKNIHGDNYDYQKVDYINSKTNVTIICIKHSEFQQRPSSHLRGAGCPKCSYHRYYSNKQLKILNLLSSYYNINIQHAENEGEYTISNSKYKADGYCKETNTIYEYHGNYWHGNPKIYNEYDINEVTGKTYGELYNNTIKKEKFIKEQGYNLVVIWERDFDNLINIVKNIQKKWRNYKNSTYL
jgi:hypothetical protein